ncbi:MAG: N-acetyltransferase [Pseudomonadota bacterium]
MSTATQPLSILKIDARSDVARDFLDLPAQLYADDPVWIEPLRLLKQQQISPKNHFFEHASFSAWVAYRDGQPVGRISAQVDQLHLAQHNDGAGYFGLLEGQHDKEVFTALFSVAEAWLREQGMQRVRGPFNLHVNEEVGLLVEGFESPPFVLMGHARPWYGQEVEGAGYRPAKDLLAYHVRPDFEAPRVMLRLAERVSDRVRVRSLRRDMISEDAAVMREIFNDAWQHNWGFVPLAEVEWQDTVSTLTKLMPDDYIQIAEYDGKPVAFIVALPNLMEAARGLNGRLLPFGWAKLLWRLKVRHPTTARVPLMGVRLEYQHSRLGPTLAFMVIDAVRKALHRRGVKDVEMGWILEDNEGMRNIIETIGGEAYKRYRIYQKEL